MLHKNHTKIFLIKTFRTQEGRQAFLSSYNRTFFNQQRCPARTQPVAQGLVWKSGRDCVPEDYKLKFIQFLGSQNLPFQMKLNIVILAEF